MTVARAIQEATKTSSWIRRMFETGQALKSQLGADNVFDFSLGNPVLEPPAAFQDALRELVTSPTPGMHGYMPNAGYPSTRRAVAAAVSRQQQLEVDAEDIVLTVGAAGALHVALHAILDPGDEVIILAPYFVEYLFYIDIHRGRPRIVETTADFLPDIPAIAAAINERTKAIVINTPNNPTGRIYTQQHLAELAAVLRAHEQRTGRAIYLIVDTPYEKIVYDGHRNPLLFSDHPHTFICHSRSKDLGLAGERIGYLVVSPRAAARLALRNACVFSNRVLGYINAPALMQRAMERAGEATIDIRPYAVCRDLLVDGLAAAGYSFVRPEGAFYLFPRSPIDDVAFAQLLLERAVLVVPGSGFGRPGHVRIAYCVAPRTIERALPHFAYAMQQAQATSPA